MRLGWGARANANANADAESIVVTGTNIRGGQATSPVIVLGR